MLTVAPNGNVVASGKAAAGARPNLYESTDGGLIWQANNNLATDGGATWTTKIGTSAGTWGSGTGIRSLSISPDFIVDRALFYSPAVPAGANELWADQSRRRHLDQDGFRRGKLGNNQGDRGDRNW